MTSPVPARLLAKSVQRDRSPLSLEQHLVHTETAARSMFAPSTRWHEAFQRFFKLDNGERAKFLPSLSVAALAHDLGKANADFQRAMKERGFAQTVRHEHLSALFLHHPTVYAWLKQSSLLDLDAVIAAVLAHHLKASPDGDYAFAQLRAAKEVTLFFAHAEIGRTLDRIAKVAELEVPPRLTLDPLFPSQQWESAFQAARLASKRLGRRMLREPCSLVFAVKAALVASDTVASALVREGHSIKAWIQEVAQRPPIDGRRVREDVIEPRTRSLEKPDKPFIFHEFQNGAAQLSSRALLLAACGTGKTLAAWRWAAAHADQRPIGRVVFLYPTRGTATEGFRDYVGWAPEGDAKLVHSTSAYELEGMAENPPESLRGKELVDESEARLFALALWSRRYFSATVDQFLSFLENQYRSLCLLPALADALVIVDEVHSFDERLFANLVTFLGRLDVPVLAMTATLPPHRKRQLETLGLEVYPRDEHRPQLADLERLERHPRYRHVRLDGPAAARREALSAVEQGQRVLWVVNVVRRAQELARSLREECACPLIAYHSRFKLEDRRRAHERTVNAFQTSVGAVVAVTTQVCEMSLDLDADVLITEDAPIPSLVQRFGRANRNLRRRGEDFRASLFTYPAESIAPYALDDMAGTTTFLSSLPEEPSQRDLARLLEEFVPVARDAPSDASCFFGGGYYATPGELRDADGSGKAVILDGDDLEKVRAALTKRESIDGFVLQVPRRYARPSSAPLPQWLGVAPSGQYDRDLGFLDEAP